MNNAKLELLKKLKSLANDTRGNEHERQSAEEHLNRLMDRYGITDEDLEVDVTERRQFYFKDEWERKLICQTIYKLFPEKDIYRTKGKKNWIWADMTDTEYIEFEMHYCAYKASFQKEFDLFYFGFLSKNKIFPDKQSDENDSNNSMSANDIWRANMMAQTIEPAQVRRLLK